MGKVLSEQDIAFYRAQGFLFPIPLLSAAEAASFRRALETHEARFGGALPKELRHKPHLTMLWADALVHHPKVLDAVEDVIGPDILCWESVLFIKSPGTPEYISWHQDITYWGLGSDEVATAWIALSPSTPESGCMRVVPGTHRREVVPHRNTFAAHNLLSRGQEIAVEVDEAKAVDIVLQPGQMSLHHVKIFHGSFENRSNDRRIGFAIRYLPPHVRQVVGAADSAMLVRGRDRFGYFELERRPRADLEPEQLAYHERLRAQRMAILMRPVEVA
ncbi:MAG: phytanoyl-CoA dioxygenase family protein [Geminicoccaceae bacterium]|nr:phytanoyl-CoA dioxygenase family protein [Geminicoccaceae bacterium]